MCTYCVPGLCDHRVEDETKRETLLVRGSAGIWEAARDGDSCKMQAGTWVSDDLCVPDLHARETCCPVTWRDPRFLLRTHIINKM